LKTRIGIAVYALAATCVLAPIAAQSPVQQPAAAANPPAALASGFKEELIVAVPSGSELKDWTARENHVAWIEGKAGAWIVRFDGKQQGGTFEDISTIAISPDGAHLHFIGKRNGMEVHVVDGQDRSPQYTSVTNLVFQPHGDSIAYSACTEKKKCRLFVDEKPQGAEYEDIIRPHYSSDGKRLAYFARRNKIWIAIVDGKQIGPDLEEFGHWGFSHDASHFYSAAWVKGEKKWTYLVDGAEGPGFDAISPLAFSSDSKHFAYSGADSHPGFKKQKTSGTVVLDGKPLASYEGKGLSGSWTGLGGSYELMATGPRDFDADFHGVSNPGLDTKGNLIYAARRDKGDVVVMQGDQAGPSFDDIVSGIAYTDDGAHFAYVARRGNSLVEVRTTQPGLTFPTSAQVDGVSWIELSEDGAHMSYELVRGGRYFKAGYSGRARRTVVVDGQLGKEYNALGIFPVRFSEDRRHYYFGVEGAEAKRVLIVVDGQESKLYDAAGGYSLAADGKGLTFFGQDSSRLLRITYPFQ
jgi:hypothetical protein